MRHFVRFLAGPAMVALVACGPSDAPSAGVPDDLQQDLAAASAASVEMASAGDYEPLQVVSAIEQPARSEPVRSAPAPRRVTRPAVADVPAVERSPEPMPQPEVMVASVPVEAEAPAEVPVITPVSTGARPTAQPIGMPASGDAGHGDGDGIGVGEAIGIVIGTVIIRGGRGGIDHCDPRTDGRRGRGGYPGVGVMGTPRVGGRLPLPIRGGISINNRVPQRGGGGAGIGIRRPR